MNLGLTRPAEKNVSEFLVVGKSEPNCQNRVIEFLCGHRGEIIYQHGYRDEALQEFVLSCCVDTSEVDCTLDELLIRLRKLKFVTKAERIEMRGQLFTSLLFPTNLAGLQRVVSIDIDSIGSIDDALRNNESRKISKLLFDEGRNASIKTCNNLRNLANAGEGNPVIDLIKDYLRAAGWGLFNFRTDGEFSFVSIADPPISGPDGSSACGVSYLSGLASGVLETLGGNKMHFRYANYEKERGVLTICLGKVELQTVVAENSATLESKPAEVEGTETRGEGSYITGFGSDLKFLSVAEKVIGAAKRGSSKVNLMNIAKLSHSDASALLDELTKRGLIELRKDENFGVSTYHATLRGEDFVDLSGRLNDVLLETARARVVKQNAFARDLYSH